MKFRCDTMIMTQCNKGEYMNIIYQLEHLILIHSYKSEMIKKYLIRLDQLNNGYAELYEGEKEVIEQIIVNEVK